MMRNRSLIRIYYTMCVNVLICVAKMGQIRLQNITTRALYHSTVYSYGRIYTIDLIAWRCSKRFPILYIWSSHLVKRLKII